MAYTDAQRKAHIKEIQGYLHGISYYNPKIPRIIPDGIFGIETQIAVKAFQQEYSLPVTGEVNRATWDKIISVYKNLVSVPPERIDVFPSKSYVMQQGERGYNITLLQIMLNTVLEDTVNYQPINISGFFDNQTVKAVKSFQAITQRPQTGSVDLFTWNILVKAFNYLAL
jgi:peptidoglycan hydrolase-like protein with peptidoglycan-binding domain